MNEWLLWGGVGLVGLASLLAISVRRVPVGEVWVIHRFGRKHRNLDSGWHGIVPLIERVAHRINMLGRTVPVELDAMATQDAHLISGRGRLCFQVLDADKASMEAGRLDGAATNLVQTVCEQMIAEMKLDDLVKRRRADTNAWILGLLNQSSANWGVRITRVEVIFDQSSSDKVSSSGP